MCNCKISFYDEVRLKDFPLESAILKQWENGMLKPFHKNSFILYIY